MAQARAHVLRFPPLFPLSAASLPDPQQCYGSTTAARGAAAPRFSHRQRRRGPARRAQAAGQEAALPGCFTREPPFTGEADPGGRRGRPRCCSLGWALPAGTAACPGPRPRSREAALADITQ